MTDQGKLVLSRKVNEKIFIGNDIIVNVAQICGNQVKLAITAPAHYKIVRDDIKNYNPKSRGHTEVGNEMRAL